MTVDVDAGGFDSAAEAFAMANAVLAQFYQGLTSALGNYSAMAGDDKTSDEFAAQYDGAARDTVGATADLVGALAGLARLTYTSGANHRGANASSVYSANPPVYTGGQFDAPPSSTVTVAAYTPPSAVGGDDPSTPQFWDMITDYLEGYTWPGADTGRLRQAAGTWRQLGTMIETLVSPYLDTAVGQLEAQRSPEIEIAVSVTKGLKLEIAQLAFHCEELAAACEGFATQVEAVREVVRGIMRDLAIEIGITAAAAGIASLFTFGGAAAGGAAIGALRLAAAARKVIQALSAMKAVVRTAAVAKIAGKIPVLSRRFRKISEAANSAKHGRYLKELRAAMGKPATQDPKLSKIMDELYRENASTGSGSTAAAVRHELATGQPVGGAFHSQKARDKIIELQRWLARNPEATPGDRAAAENVIKDMQDALAGN